MYSASPAYVFGFKTDVVGQRGASLEVISVLVNRKVRDSHFLFYLDSPSFSIIPFSREEGRVKKLADIPLRSAYPGLHFKW